DISAAQGQYSHHRLDQGRLPRAIRTDDTHEFPRRQRQVYIPQHRLALKGNGEVVDLESGFGVSVYCHEFNFVNFFLFLLSGHFAPKSSLSLCDLIVCSILATTNWESI